MSDMNYDHLWDNKHGVCKKCGAISGKFPGPCQKPNPLDHSYGVVGEMLEYFDQSTLATWAPLVALIERERRAAFLEGYRRGFYSSGNYFPEESWLKFTNRPPVPPRREPSLEERPY